jgi:hypothetical protein
MAENRVVYRVLVGNVMERDRLGDQSIDGKIILRWFFRKWCLGYGLD